MKDKIIQAIRIIIGLGMFAYIIWLYTQGAVVASEKMMQYNMIILSFLGLLYLLLAIMGIFNWCLPKARLNYFLLGIFLVLFGNFMIKDNPSSMVFLADLTNVVGVLFVIAGPTGIIIPEKCRKEQENKNAEIIEV